MTSGGIDARRAGYEGYEDVGRAAAIERREPGGWLAISGGDVVSFLQGVLTNDVAALATGEHCYAAYLTAQGRMLSDMQVLRREADVLLAVEPEVAGALAERFDKSIFTEDVRVQDLSGTLQTVGVHGPSSHGAVAAIFGDRLAPGIRQALDGGRHVTVPFEGSDVIVFGSNWLGTPGVRIAAAGSQLATIVNRLIGSGVPVLGPAAVAARRIEAGTPVFGIDMTPETIPLEAGIEDRERSARRRGATSARKSSSASSIARTAALRAGWWGSSWSRAPFRNGERPSKPGAGKSAGFRAPRGLRCSDARSRSRRCNAISPRQERC